MDYTIRSLTMQPGTEDLKTGELILYCGHSPSDHSGFDHGFSYRI